MILICLWLLLDNAIEYVDLSLSPLIGMDIDFDL